MPIDHLFSSLIGWLDGNMAKQKEELLPEQTTRQETYLSHSFYFRASHVEGNILTNESSVLWYTTSIHDDNQTITLNRQCFDNHGDCVRWRQEGFCESNPDSQSYYVKQNPGFVNWVRNNCFVSCKVGCASPLDEPNHDGDERKSVHDEM